jgi:tetratricopeptide (TPR) repeat protein
MKSDKSDTAWRVLHLENQYLHCMVLPDLGGHLYTCRDKLSGTDVFYANTAIKKYNVAPRGAWVATGIETSFPVAHSRVTVSPVQFATNVADGSATVFVGAVDRISGMEWRVGYTLRPGDAVLHQKTWLYNPGMVRQPYQWWTNAAIRLPNTGLQFTYPMWVTAPHGAGVLETWPVDTHGVDRTQTANYTDALGLFGHGSREPFFAVYNPQSRTGVAHWAEPREVPGKKIWVWGEKDKGYKEFLSDDHSGYVEIQAGLMETQDMMDYLEPQQSRVFTELWIPSRKIGGITRATPAAVLFLQRKPQTGGTVRAVIGLNVTRVLPQARLTVTKGDSVILQKTADLDPGTAFQVETEPVDAAGKFRFELKDASGQVLLAHQEDTYDAVTPAEVKIGTLPTSAANDPLGRAAENELARIVDRAATEYEAALKASPKSPAVQKSAGRFYLALNRFAEAAAILGPLQRESPTDAEVTYYLGVAKSQLGDDAAARPLWESIQTDPRFGVAAQDRLACALARAGQHKAAAGMLHAIAARSPGRAAGLEVALLRRMGQTAEAEAALKKALSENPMDSLLRVESVLLGHEDATIWIRLGADPEWVLDVADAYLDAGLYQDAVALLSRDFPAAGELQTEPGAVAPQNYPLIGYYRGYARLRAGQSPNDDFAKAAGQSTLYVHPYRASSYAVLRAAVEQFPNDGTAHFLLGCLLFNSRATDQALKEWDLAKSSLATIPAYYETVARVLVRTKDERRIESLIKEGIADRPDLRNLFAGLRSGTAVASNAPVASAPSFKSPEEAADYALTMLVNQNPSAAEVVFQGKNFPGGRQPLTVRRTYIEARLQNLLSAARTCNSDAATRFANFAQPDPDLSFTSFGFTDITGDPRMQFYLGLAESMCGNRRAAERRWTRIASSRPAPSSVDFAFQVLAASVLDPARSQRTVETALEGLRTGGGPSEKGLRLYMEGILLRAAGREEEAMARFRAGAAESNLYTRYLNTSAQNDPPLPH